jgi:hypothetical protein
MLSRFPTLLDAEVDYIVVDEDGVEVILVVPYRVFGIKPDLL